MLRATNLSKSYGRRKVISQFCMKVRKGDIYGFLGRNGQGKTTVLRLLTGLARPDQGEVTIGGFSLKTDFKAAMTQLGAVVEAPALYGYLSGFENLMIAARLSGHGKKEALEALEATGLESRANEKTKGYSFGMKQRLGLATAILGNPKLAILDEPLNGLDPQGVRETRELIAQLASERGITFLISSHSLSDIEQISTRIGIIHEGRMALEAGTEELKASGKTLEEIYFGATGRGGHVA
jgi:ABC-2 type transport system ATP-binding protein